MEKKLEAPLRAAVAVLEQNGYSYALIGGLALAQWGVVRATHDVDFRVLVPEVDYTAVRTALRSAFPRRARITIPENPLIVDVDIEGATVDFLLALPGYEELIVQRAVERDLGGFLVRVATAEDLIIQKVVANRGKDWQDVEMLLLAQRDQLKQTYIVEWLAQFAEALEQPELLTEYTRVRGRADAFR